MTRFVRALLGAGVLAIGVGLAQRAQHERERLKVHVDAAPLLQALVKARQPASVSAAVQRACNADDGCACTEVAARAALDADLHELATQALDAAPKACPKQNKLLGERAEALARAGAKNARDSAETVLRSDPKSEYAELALARVEYDSNHMKLCSEHAGEALQLGRGAEAERLLARSALTRQLYEEAEAHFQKVLEWNPNDLEAAFSAAVCNDKLGRYLQAREGFLQTLHIDPKHVAARAYLVVLTHNVGANDEARHHLEKLKQILPNGAPNLASLEQLVEGSDRDGGAPPSPNTVSAPSGRIMVQGKN
jgi:tetratricopeptide (TPR) repeat protein